MKGDEMKGYKTHKITPSKSAGLSDMPEKHYPSLHLDAKDYPEIKKCDVGKEYVFEIKVKMTSKNISNYRGEGNTSGSFEIHSIKKETEEDKD